MRFQQDKSGELKEYFESIIDRDFEDLSHLNFVYVWREEEKTDDEGNIIIATVRKLSNRDRDVFDFDCCIEVDQGMWDKLSDHEKFKISFHECSHIKVDTVIEKNKPMPKRDKNGRISFSVKDHDLVLKRFREELIKFGLSKEEEDILIFLKKVNELHAGKTNKNKSSKVVEIAAKRKKVNTSKDKKDVKSSKKSKNSPRMRSSHA